MTHFGLVCPPMSSHLKTMYSLGKELQKRGHRVTLFGVLDTEASTVAAGIEFHPIGKSEYPIGAIEQLFTQQGKLVGFAALMYCIKWLKELADMFLREAPAAIKATGVEALVVDQVSPEGGTAADFLELPFATVCSGLLLNRDPNVPPYNTTWSCSSNWLAQLRNRISQGFFDFIERSIWEVLFEYRRQWKLPVYSNYDAYYSQLAQLSQQPAEFEFPRPKLPKWFHFTGPYHSPLASKPISFPYQELTGQPLIYASLGTVMGQQMGLFRDIATACDGLDAQLVITMGGVATPEALQNLPGSPLVVKYAPQLELLQKTTLTITHAGLNTTLECLSNGIPMVAIPMVNDQPGIAARIAWTGSGEVVPLPRLTVPKLRNAIERTLAQDSYKQNAMRLQTAIAQAGGVSRAADIVEKMASIGKPVLA